MSLINIFGVIGVIGTTLISVWAVFRYFLFCSYRLDNDMSKRIIDIITREAQFKWFLADEFVREPKYPDTFELFTKVRGIYMYFSRAERLLTAGWKGKEEATSLYYCRWQHGAVLALLNQSSSGKTVPVMALTPSGADRLGELECQPTQDTVLPFEIVADIEADVARVVSSRSGKTSCLLYGPPGNGKTQFVKYLAKKYSLPINVVYLNPEYCNLDIATMFSAVPPNSIVLLEDFDNYFDGRECIIKNDQVKFTFDAIINALDGVHNDYRGNVFVMTANNIDVVDDSLKSRPSRFKFVREFGNPTLEVRRRILGDDNHALLTEGLSLDKVFAFKTHPCLVERQTTSPTKKSKRKKGS